MTKIQLMVDGGKASPTPQLAQALGPMKIPVNEVISKINEKTKELGGMKVPVDVVLKKDKQYDIVVGSPPTSELIKKAAGIEKGGGTPDKVKVANITIEQVIKIAVIKQEKLATTSLKRAVKTIAGSCSSLGVLVEGKTGAEINALIEEGKYDAEINGQKTEPSSEKTSHLKQQLEEVNARLKREAEKLAKAREAEKAATAPAATTAAAAAPTAEAAKAGETPAKGKEAAPAKEEAKPAGKEKFAAKK